jgi:LmbE family N-acetylglucosaminyl deacetylase
LGVGAFVVQVPEIDSRATLPALLENAHVVLAVAAHPDDIEINCGSLLGSLAERDVQINYLIASDGELGFERELPIDERRAIRRREQLAAAMQIGVADVKFLGYPDGELEVKRELIEDITCSIRSLKPDLLLSYDPYSRVYRYHPDHRAIGRFTVEAAFPAARSPLYFHKQVVEGLKPHSVSNGLLFDTDEPDFFFQVDPGQFVKKLAAVECHKSQLASLRGGARGVIMRRLKRDAAHTEFELAEGFKLVDFG